MPKLKVKVVDAEEGIMLLNLSFAVSEDIFKKLKHKKMTLEHSEVIRSRKSGEDISVGYEFYIVIG